MKTLEEAILLDVIKQNGLYICNIENPTEEMKLEAVKQNPSVIHYLDNPSGYLLFLSTNPKEPSPNQNNTLRLSNSGIWNYIVG